MRKKHLEMLLSGFRDHPSPKPELEQYSTPPGIAADILFWAMSEGDIIDRSVLDPGCGCGIFAIGAAVLGARKVVGLDVDGVALQMADENLGYAVEKVGPLGTAISFERADISKIVQWGGFDTVVMNPPFGAQNRGADRPFLDLAMASAGTIYSIHNGKGIGFVKDRFERGGFRITGELEYMFPIPHRFGFHTSENVMIGAKALLARKE